jgi:hypothetical protein
MKGSPFPIPSAWFAAETWETTQLTWRLNCYEMRRYYCAAKRHISSGHVSVMWEGHNGNGGGVTWLHPSVCMHAFEPHSADRGRCHVSYPPRCLCAVPCHHSLALFAVRPATCTPPRPSPLSLCSTPWFMHSQSNIARYVPSPFFSPLRYQTTPIYSEMYIWNLPFKSHSREEEKKALGVNYPKIKHLTTANMNMFF